MTAATVETRIHEAIDRLTAAEKRAARGLLSNYPVIGLAPVAEFAKASGVSAATILRFISALGFSSYPRFQRALRNELQERVKSPLERPAPRRKPGTSAEFFERFVHEAAHNIDANISRIPASEFEAACTRLSEVKHAVHLAGGRFTDPIAAYLEAHLRIVRPGVRRLEGRSANRADQMLDVRAGDTVLLFDIRRYDPQLQRTADMLARRKAFVMLITDEWISPVSRLAKIVMPCRTGGDRTWDTSAALFVLVEAMIARVTELSWPAAAERIGAIERQSEDQS